MKGIRFHDSKLKLVKVLSFHSFQETETPIAFYCFTFICGRAYLDLLSKKRTPCLSVSIGVHGPQLGSIPESDFTCPSRKNCDYRKV